MLDGKGVFQALFPSWSGEPGVQQTKLLSSTTLGRIERQGAGLLLLM
jgi:hypothetical protein